MKAVFVLDLDGVLTDGKFYYSIEGKLLKSFGPDDNDALQEISKFLEVVVISADTNGFEISRRRVENDMKLELYNVGSLERIKWIRDRYEGYFKIYMGDGFYDHLVFNEVDLAIAPANASERAKASADFITKRSGGDRAVAEACVRIASTIFNSDI